MDRRSRIGRLGLVGEMRAAALTPAAWFAAAGLTGVGQIGQPARV